VKGGEVFVGEKTQPPWTQKQTSYPHKLTLDDLHHRLGLAFLPHDGSAVWRRRTA